MAKIKGLGTSLSYLPAYNDGGAVKVIGALTSIGELAPDAEELDATTLDSANGYREFIQGFKDSGELTVTGLHDKTDTGQEQLRTLYLSGATGYFWIQFADMTVVAFTAYVKNYTAGPADVDGLVGFAAALRITGLVQVLSMLDPVAQSKTAGQTATMVSTAVALTGTPTYQWKTCVDLNYGTPANVVGGTGGTTDTYITPALTSGVKYFFCVITVSGYRPINSGIHVITVT